MGASLFGGAFFCLSGEAIAAPCGPVVFTYGGSDWCTDRADTASHTVVNGIGGRDGVLDLGIKKATTLPWVFNDFYETEGYKTNTGNPVGASFVSGDVYIPGSWQAQTAAYASVGLWGTLGPGVPQPAFPIVGFFNGDAGGGKIRYFDGGVGYVDAPSAVINYNGWNTFRLNYLPGPTGPNSVVQVVVNGAIVGTITGAAFTSIDPATASQYEIILNAHTNGQSAYDTYWSNITWSLNEAYYDAAGIAPAAIATGDMLLGTYVDRRGLDWDGGKAAWMHAVAGGATINTGNGTVRPSVSGAQFGLDLLALGDPSTRLGATFGYGSQSSAITLPSGASGGTVGGNSPSLGAYITHADSNMYVDVLGQYRWLNTNVAAPTSTGTVSGNSIDVTAETGVHFGTGVVTVTPFAQLSYQHLTLNSATLGGLPVSFGNSDALIGRARVLLEANNAGLKIFGSAGVAQDLLGAKNVTVAGTTFASTLGGGRAEFTGGVEGTLAPQVSVYGSGEYDISFDGKSSSYAARAGFRAGF